MSANCNKELPQEGTDLTEIGESLGASALCPTYSGGGTSRLESISSLSPSIISESVGKIPHKVDELKEDDGLFVQPQSMTNTARNSAGEESDCSIMSYSSQTSAVSEGTRAKKRGRRAIESVSPTAIKRSLFLKKQKTDEAGPDEYDILDPSVLPSQTRAKKNLPSVVSLGTEMQERPTDELGACIKEQLITVEKIADKSRNLKGNLVQSLWIAVRTIEAATLEMAQRTSANVNIERLERENSELRSKMATLEAKVEKLAKSSNDSIQSGRPQANTRPIDPPTLRPTVGGTDWENQFMERIGNLMDKKLKSFKTQLSFPQGSTSQILTPITGPNESSQKIASKKKSQQPLAATVPLQQVVTAQPAVIPAPLESAGTWTTVEGRKKKRKKGKKEPSSAQKTITPNKKAGSTSRKARPARLPKTAAIAVTIPEGSVATYASVMTAAKERIKLSECGVDAIRPRRAITGGLILEIAGTDCASKANMLADKMKDTLKDMDVYIMRPIKTGELRVMDLDEAVTSEEVASAVAKEGGCSKEEVKVGVIRRSLNSLGTVWVRCPLASVKKLAVAKRILVGWVSARVEILTARPLQCYRCLELGHVRRMCPNTTDRSKQCYACGENDHRAKECTRPLKCPLCSDLGRSSDHRLGSKKCTPPRSKKKGHAGVRPAQEESTQKQVPSEVPARQDSVLSEEVMEAS